MNGGRRLGHWAATLTIVALLCGAANPVAAQGGLFPPAFNFDLETQSPTVTVQRGDTALISVLFHDRSRSGTGGWLPDGEPSAGFSNEVLFHVRKQVADPQWSVLAPPALFSRPGETHEVFVRVAVTGNPMNSVMPIEFTATVSTPDGGEHRLSAILYAYFPGSGFEVQVVGGTFQVRPQEIVNIPVRIQNSFAIPRTFDIHVDDAGCGMSASTARNFLVGARSAETYFVTVQAPDHKPWFNSESCPVQIRVTLSGEEAGGKTAFAAVQVHGVYIDPVWVFWASMAILAAVLLFLLAKSRKERIEEGILGKPQKPWTIPVEQVYLERLKEKDPRAWYVVRHHLMEEEYQSALLWYHSYKHATKATRKAERAVLKEERAYARWRAKWLAKVAHPTKAADRYEQILQRRLERRERRRHRKEMGKWRRLNRKLEAAHKKRVAKATATWEKKRDKAARKGRPEPPRPEVPEPDYPERSGPRPVALAGHSWNKRAQKHRARMERLQGDLEVRFEKADARYRERLLKRLERLAERLDDPAFVHEHPLLEQAIEGGPASSSST